MTTYNTGSPVGSSAAKDLYDNAENFDVLVNDQSLEFYPDRLGVNRKTWRGMEKEFNEFMLNSGFVNIGDYAADIEITGYNQTVRDSSGHFWRLDTSVSLPYTTTGAGLPEGGAFIDLGNIAYWSQLGTVVESDLVQETGSSEINVMSQKAVSDKFDSLILDGYNKYELIAHRGFADVFIENTIYALESSILSGADAVEFDLAVSGDGTIFLFHDSDVSNLTSGSGIITELSDSYIETLVYSDAVGTAIAGYKIDTFEKASEVFSQYSCNLYPEIKVSNMHSNSDIDAMLDIAKSNNIGSRCTWLCFDYSKLLYLKGLDRTSKVGFLVGDVISLSQLKIHIDTIAADFGVLGSLSTDVTNIFNNPEIVSYAREKGVGLVAWTVKTYSQYKKLINLGVRKITSDINIGRIK